MQWIYEPWAIATAVGIGAFLLGLLIPKKGGSSWLSAVVFFLPNLFLDVLDMVHTKKFKYYGLILALLSIEAFFAFRAATVYYDVLSSRMPATEMAIVCVIVFIAVFLCGYMVATHGGKWNFWRVCTMVFVIMHDWAGTVWMNYSQPATSATTAATTSGVSNDTLKVVLTVGMCVLGLLPFIMGAWAEELRPELEAEMEEEVNAFTSMATRKIKRRAVDRVLRLANHTNVVHLVRALPADEFADFKKFVMPIIAPGTPYNLAEQPDNLADKMTDTILPIVAQETGQNGESSPDKMSNENQQNGSPATGQNGDIPTGKMATFQPAKTEKNGSQEPASKTAIRDEKIRQHAAKYPKMTHAKLATKFKVSERTIARALASQVAAMSEKQEPTALLENAEEKPSTNGHHKSQEPNTDEMEAIVISEDDLAITAQLN